ncbi:MAG TPA: SAM-dependent methyltransferase, partial [Lachnoclostridium phytofermentans]|nr:SAM-dependent methyltransferase [Lachnoclostridium phytofermentans]
SGWKIKNAHYHRSNKGGGEWEFIDLPKQWQIRYKELTFNLQPFSFKHTGLFPEQATNWDWFGDKIRKAKEKNPNREIKVLNLFAYTGGATLAAAKAGANVTHVDASKGMVTWAKENAESSGLGDAPIRYIVDDCVKFVEREIRRGNQYDAIIMDPPSYGRGPKGEIWKIEESIHPFVKLCTEVLTEKPLFYLINSYTTGLQPAVLAYMLGIELQKKFGGTVNAEEIGLPVTSTGLVLPCGASGRWED